MKIRPQELRLFVWTDFHPGEKRNAWLWNAHRTAHDNAIFFAPGNMLLGALRKVDSEELRRLARNMKPNNCELKAVEAFIDNHKHANCLAFSLNLKN